MFTPHVALHEYPHGKESVTLPLERNISQHTLLIGDAHARHFMAGGSGAPTQCRAGATSRVVSGARFHGGARGGAAGATAPCLRGEHTLGSTFVVLLPIVLKVVLKVVYTLIRCGSADRSD